MIRLGLSPGRLMCAVVAGFSFLLAAAGARGDHPPVKPIGLDPYHVIWDTPSDDMHGSMPIGNGDLAANVWVEPNGDLLFYLSRSDAWSAEQELLKLGKIRVRLDPPFCAANRSFRQDLDLRKGRIVFDAEDEDGDASMVFWIDANRPVATIEIKGSRSFKARVTLESWRLAGAPLPSGAMPDTILPAEDSTIRWYQRNTRSIFAEVLENQHLGHLIDRLQDPLIHRTFGGLMAGEGLVSDGDAALVTSDPVKDLTVRVHALTAQTDTPEAWIDLLHRQRTAVEEIPLSLTREAHEAWWRDFWDRSYIQVTGNADADAVTRAYALQRWIQAGAGRGAYPIKFNGSLFTVDGFVKEQDSDNIMEMGPDWRQWGGCYWFQNTREPYWAMLYSGDYDQMQPLWKMYRDARPLLRERTRHYFNHDGIFCSETMYFWGLNRNNDYGQGNQGFYPENPYIRYYWDSGNELSMMMLDYYAHTRDDDFARETLVPIADDVVTFYDQHHERTPEGKVLFSPASSLETWHSAEDPLPVVIGLRTVLTRLLELPASLTTPDQRARWARFRSELPDLPMYEEEDGARWLEPARTYDNLKNSENPELYAVFPYRAYALGRPDLEIGLETWKQRRVKRTGGWSQDAIQAALLGLTVEAKEYVTRNATDKSIIREPVKEPRFPAFWGPNFDWLPDQCQGSVTMIALQRMLMQCDGDTILLLPSWPSDWNADFKLHAPGNTTVEGRVVQGNLIDLRVAPASRRDDVVIGPAKD